MRDNSSQIRVIGIGPEFKLFRRKLLRNKGKVVKIKMVIHACNPSD
jgi:hypothetical protein